MELIQRALALGFVLYALVAQTAQGADPKKIVVFDLDGVVLYEHGAASPADKVIKVKTNRAVGGDTAAHAESFRVAEGFPEFLAALEKSGYTVHVFSFGNETRNRDAMEKIRLPDGRSAAQLIESTGGKIFSTQHGVNLDANDKRQFDHRQVDRPETVKSLEAVLGPEAAKHAVLIDDIPKNAAPTERNTNLLLAPFGWAYDTTGTQNKSLNEDLAAAERALIAAGRENEIPEARLRLARINRKMQYLAGLLARAEDRAALSGRTIPEELSDLQWVRDSSGKIVQTEIKNRKGEVVGYQPKLRDGLVDDAQILARGQERLRTRGQAQPSTRFGLPLLNQGPCLLSLQLLP